MNFIFTQYMHYLQNIYYEYDIGDIWKYLALCLIDKIEGEAWRDANT